MDSFATAVAFASLSFTSVASIGFTAWMVTKVYTSHLPLSVVAGIAKQTEDAVRARVKISNSLLHGKASPSLEDIEEAPVPTFFQSGSVDDMHEINRELKRHRNAKQDMAAAIRDLGIGVEEA